MGGGAFLTRIWGSHGIGGSPDWHLCLGVSRSWGAAEEVPRLAPALGGLKALGGALGYPYLGVSRTWGAARGSPSHCQHLGGSVGAGSLSPLFWGDLGTWGVPRLSPALGGLKDMGGAQVVTPVWGSQGRGSGLGGPQVIVSTWGAQELGGAPRLSPALGGVSGTRGAQSVTRIWGSRGPGVSPDCHQHLGGSQEFGGPEVVTLI